MSFRVASTKPEEIHTGATFAPGEEAAGFDPDNEEDARKLEEGLFVEVSQGAARRRSKTAKTEKTHQNQEEN